MHFAVIALFSVIAVSTASHYVPIVHEPVHHAPKPYKFGYNVKDKHGDQYREETGDGAGTVKGSYGFTDARGVHRRVDYVADHAGFRAQVKTNEPGTANQDPAAVKMISSADNGYAVGAGLLGAGYGIGAGLLAGYAAPVAVAPIAPAVGYGGNYGGALLDGAVSGYDSRFGAY